MNRMETTLPGEMTDDKAQNIIANCYVDDFDVSARAVSIRAEARRPETRSDQRSQRASNAHAADG